MHTWHKEVDHLHVGLSDVNVHAFSLPHTADVALETIGRVWMRVQKELKVGYLITVWK